MAVHSGAGSYVTGTQTTQAALCSCFCIVFTEVFKKDKDDGNQGSGPAVVFPTLEEMRLELGERKQLCRPMEGGRSSLLSPRCQWPPHTPQDEVGAGQLLPAEEAGKHHRGTEMEGSPETTSGPLRSDQ